MKDWKKSYLKKMIIKILLPSRERYANTGTGRRSGNIISDREVIPPVCYQYYRGSVRRRTSPNKKKVIA